MVSVVSRFAFAAVALSVLGGLVALYAGAGEIKRAESECVFGRLDSTPLLNVKLNCRAVQSY